MPELPEVQVLVEALEERLLRHPLRGVRLASPFLLRTVEPPLAAFEGRAVVGLRRLGKRIVLAFEEELFLVFHLMIAGRFRWRARDAAIPGRIGLAALDFEAGTLLVTEQGTKKRASLHACRGEEALGDHDRGGLEVLGSSVDAFAAALRRENRTLKRALCDPRFLSGIGNTYSDEILFAARLSPFAKTQSLGTEELQRLHAASCQVLELWLGKLREEARETFPERMRALREDRAVHGRYGSPCPECAAPIQRIRYAGREANYCARCQTGGKLLADRVLSRLLKDDWPKRLEDLEGR